MFNMGLKLLLMTFDAVRCTIIVPLVVMLALVSLVFAEVALLLCRLLGLLKPNPEIGKEKRIVIVTDTHPENVCGVLRKYEELIKHLRDLNYEVLGLDPGLFSHCMTLPRQPDVKVPVPWPWMVFNTIYQIELANPSILNVMAEGTLGFVAQAHCRLTGRPYSTMFCTRTDLYMAKFAGPLMGYLCKQYLALYHNQSTIVITPSGNMKKVLEDEKYVNKAKNNCKAILNGCNTEEFTVEGDISPHLKDLKKPIWLYVGRVAVEKNIKKLLDLHDQLEGTIVIVGKGPYYDEAVQDYNKPNIKFLGWRKGKELHDIYRSATVFVFPSLTDTFGQVMVEAMASGLTVAAYNVTGPLDVVKTDTAAPTGCLDDDLKKACDGALEVTRRPGYRKNCSDHAKTFNWEKMTKEFLKVILSLTSVTLM
eukprot:m.270043 g.270043  ORF g.270043 m.270043 type:complete len:421 (-) comp16261_c4_seq1:580-1842(-)